MARKSLAVRQAEAAIANLQCIHELAVEAEALGESRRHAVYLRNASDCSRWCESVKKAGLDYPQFMHNSGLKYFGTMWRV